MPFWAKTARHFWLATPKYKWPVVPALTEGRKDVYKRQTMSQGLKKLIFNLCDAPGTSGQEPVDVAARELRKYAEVRIDHNNNVIGELGNPDSHYHIMPVSYTHLHSTVLSICQ